MTGFDFKYPPGRAFPVGGVQPFPCAQGGLDGALGRYVFFLGKWGHSRWLGSRNRPKRWVAAGLSRQTFSIEYRVDVGM